MKLIKSMVVVAAFLIASCTQDSSLNTNEEALTGISAEIKAKIINLGFNPKDSYRFEDGFMVEGDIFLTENDLAGLPDHKIPTMEQYRTTNLVTAPRVITVSIKLGGGGLPASYGAALDEALARYNAEGLSLTFQRVNNGGDIQLVKANGNYLASAGFPTSGGSPYNRINVNSRAIGNQPQSTVASIMAHEMGHCIGFRHTDYFDRSISCNGSPTDEGASSVGAIHIAGTPTGATNAAQSWMLSCIGSGQNRPFNNDDVTALNALY